MYIERIPDLTDRKIATKVMSDLAYNASPDSLDAIDNTVLSAYLMLQQSGTPITEMSLKSVVNSIFNGEISPNQVTGGGQTQQDIQNPSASSYGYKENNFVEANRQQIGMGQGYAPLGQPYGQERRVQEGMINTDPGLGESIADAAGTFAWNFTDSLLMGLPGLIQNKIGHEYDNGFVDFVDGMRRVDTEAGKWGAGLGVAASFLAPGGLITDVTKAGRVINKGNLAGHVFASGGKIVRKVTGVTGKFDEAGRAARNLANETFDVTESVSDIRKLRDAARAKKAAAVSKLDELKTAAAAEGKTEITGDAAAALNKTITQAEAEATLLENHALRLEKVAENPDELRKVIQQGTRRASAQLYDLRRKLKASEITELTTEGLSEGVKARIRFNTYGKLVDILGDTETASLVMDRALKNLDPAIKGMVKGTKTWGEAFADTKFLGGFSERVAKILQNGTEEALGFGIHTMAYHTISQLGETEDYDLETLKEIGKEAVVGGAHSALTGYVFAAGGGIPFLNQGGTIFTMPMKLFAPSRKTDLKEVFRAWSGAAEHEASIFTNGAHKYLTNAHEIKKILSESKQGFWGGSGSILKRLRERNLIDYKKLAARDPDAVATIAARIEALDMGAVGGLSALERAGGYSARGSLTHYINQFTKAVIDNDPAEKSKIAMEMAKYLEAQAKKSIDMNWQGVSRAMKYDSWRTALTSLSIFTGTGGIDMIKAAGNGDAHWSDVLTHGMFSVASASHGLYKMPGKAIGDPTFDNKMSAVDEVMADNQNRLVMKALGVNIGEPVMFKGMSKPDRSIFDTRGSADVQIKKLLEIGDDATEDDVNRMEVLSDSAETRDYSYQATVSEIRSAYDFFRRSGKRFKPDSPLAILNDLFDKDTVLSEEQLTEKNTEMGKALAYLASKMFDAHVKNGIVDQGMSYAARLDDGLIMNYANEYYTRKVSELRDTATRNFNRLKELLGITGLSMKDIKFGNLEGVAVEGVDNHTAQAMMDRLQNLMWTMGVSVRDYGSDSSAEPIIITADKAPEILKLLKDANAEVADNFNGIGIDNPVLSRDLVSIIRGGFASAGKAFFVDGAKQNVVHKRQAIGRAGFIDLENMAIQRGFIKRVGDSIVEVAGVDADALKKAGLNNTEITELRNFLDVMRAAYGFKGRRSKPLTAEQARRFWERMEVPIKDIAENAGDMSLSEFTKAMNIDFENNIASRDMEYHIMRAATSKLSPEKIAAFNFLKAIGLIYEDPVHGYVALKVRMEDTPGKNAIDEESKAPGDNDPLNTPDMELVKIIKDMATDPNIGLTDMDKANGVDLDPFNNFLNEEIQPVLDDLIKMGVVSRYAPKSTYARLAGSDPAAIAKQLHNLWKGRNYFSQESAKNSLAELIRVLNEADAKKEYKGIDYTKVRALSNKIVYLLGKKNPTAYDWLQVKKIVDRYGGFTDKMDEAKFNDAMNEVDAYLRDTDFADSIVERYHKGGYEVRLDNYDAILGNEKHHAYTIAKLLGADQLGIDPVRQRIVIAGMREAAKGGRGTFVEYLTELINARKNKDVNIDLSQEDIAGMYSSLKSSRSIKKITLGDFLEIADPSVKEREGVSAGVKEETLNVNEGFLTRLGDTLGLDLALLDGTISLADTNYDFFKEHDPSIEKQKLARLEELRRGGVTYLTPSADEATGSITWSLGTRNGRSVLLPFGDMQSFVVVSLPDNEVGALELSRKLDTVIDLYNGSYSGAFANALNNLKQVRDYLRAGDTTNAYRSQGALDEAFGFLFLHELVGVSGMEKVTNDIQTDNLAKTFSRYRQANSRNFIRSNRESIEQFLKPNTPGYSEGKMKVMIVDDENLPGLDAGKVTRGDGQVFFHPNLLSAQGNAHGFAGEHGVLKNMIIDQTLGKNGENLGTFLTKNSGTVNPEMTALMEKLGVSVIIAKSAVKIPGSKPTGRFLDINGNEVRINEVLNGKEFSTIEGTFDMDVSSLRFMKVPHEAPATVGYQIENLISGDIVEDLIQAHYRSKFEGGFGVLDLSKEIFSDTPEARAKLRAFVIKQLSSAKFSERLDVAPEMGNGGGVSDMYLHSSPYGSPSDFWFKPRALSVLKKGALQNSIFKTKEESGRQDILAADLKGVLETNEGVAAHGARNLSLHDRFDGSSPYGFMFAFKLDGDDAVSRASQDVDEFFGYTKRGKKNYYNRFAEGARGPAETADVEERLAQSKYVYRRLFRINPMHTTSKNFPTNSFVFDAIMEGVRSGKTEGIYKHLSGMDKDSPAFRNLVALLNNHVIDVIEGKYDPTNLSRLQGLMPEEMYNDLLASMTSLGERRALDKHIPPEGHHSIGKVYDIVGSVLGNYDYHKTNATDMNGRSPVTWGIASTNQRYPSARINDTIPVVYLGFLDKSMGHQVIMNYYDSVLKGESDYDIDNYNYWFRMPTSHFAEINRLRSAAGINKADPPQKKIDDAGVRSFNPFNYNDMMTYSRHQARAAFLRGVTINSASAVEKMVKDKYNITFKHGGKEVTISSRFGTLEEALNNDEGIAAFMHSSKMVQEIIDSKKGFLSHKYMDKDFDPFEEIVKKFYKVTDENGNEIEWRSEYYDMARGSISPYKRLLGFTKKSWVGDSSESMNWNEMRDIVLNWERVNEENPERNIEDIIRSYAGIKPDDENITDVKFSFSPTASMAEDAARKIIKLDRVYNSGESSELLGRKAASVAELGRYLSQANWGENPTDEQIAEFVGMVNTRNWNVKQAVFNLKKMYPDLKRTRDRAMAGDKFAMQRLRIIERQYENLKKIESALRKKKIVDPEVMHRFSGREEAASTWDNTKSVEALKNQLATYGVDKTILQGMMADAFQIKKLRGRLWSAELNAKNNKHTAVYGKQRELELTNAIQKYMDRWYHGASNFGELSYTPEAAILALVVPDAEFAYTGSHGRRFIGYKNVPADLFNIAVQLSVGKNVDDYSKFMSDLAYTHAITSQYMEGRSGEINEILRMRKMKDDHNNLIAVASRFNRRRGEVSIMANVLRNLGYGENDITDQAVVEKVFGISFKSMAALGNRTPEEELQERIYASTHRKVYEKPITDVFGTEHNILPVIRVELKPDRFVSDNDGTFDNSALALLETRNRSKPKKDRIDLDTRNETTWNRVAKKVDEMQSTMVKMILGRTESVTANDLDSAGFEDSLGRLVRNRSGRDSDLQKNGVCP